jgi:hypothetical protein
MSNGEDPMMTGAQVAAALGVPLTALWTLMSNAQFPTALTNDVKATSRRVRHA